MNIPTSNAPWTRALISGGKTALIHRRPGGRVCRLTDADQPPCGQEGTKRSCESAEERRTAPEKNARADDRTPRDAIGQHAQRKTCQGKNHGEHRRQTAQLSKSQPKLPPDCGEQREDDLPVNVVHKIH